VTFGVIPDFLFARERIAVLTHGCFWHGCPRCGHVPHTNSAYWRVKIARNQRRDRNTRRALGRAGYAVVALWECQLKRSPDECVARIGHALSTRRPQD